MGSVIQPAPQLFQSNPPLDARLASVVLPALTFEVSLVAPVVLFSFACLFNKAQSVRSEAATGAETRRSAIIFASEFRAEAGAFAGIGRVCATTSVVCFVCLGALLLALPLPLSSNAKFGLCAESGFMFVGQSGTVSVVMGFSFFAGRGDDSATAFPSGAGGCGRLAGAVSVVTGFSFFAGGGDDSATAFPFS